MLEPRLKLFHDSEIQILSEDGPKFECGRTYRLSPADAACDTASVLNKVVSTGSPEGYS